MLNLGMNHRTPKYRPSMLAASNEGYHCGESSFRIGLGTIDRVQGSGRNTNFVPPPTGIWERTKCRDEKLVKPVAV